jgi:hypothetical protein
VGNRLKTGARRWTKDEVLALYQGAGTVNLDWIQRHTECPYDYEGAPPHRSLGSIHQKAHREFGIGGTRRGTYSLKSAAEKSGYAPSQIRRARAALGQKWKRTSSRGPYLISEDQYFELVEWLAGDYWSVRNRQYACEWCGCTDRHHYALGLCRMCYRAAYRRLKRVGIAFDGIRAFLLENSGSLDAGVLERCFMALDKGRWMRKGDFWLLFARKDRRHGKDEPRGCAGGC